MDMLSQYLARDLVSGSLACIFGGLIG